MLNYGAVILAGGKNSRMGKNKAFLSIQDERIIDRLVVLLGSLFPETIIISNNTEIYRYLGVRVKPDVLPNMGPLGGIHAGFIHTSYEYNFIVACDLPFLQKEIISYLVGVSKGNDVTVPKIRGHLQPLCAVYSRACLPVIQRYLENSDKKVVAFYPEIRVRHVDEIEISLALPAVDLTKVFYNVNTPGELLLAHKMVRSSQSGLGKKDCRQRHLACFSTLCHS